MEAKQSRKNKDLHPVEDFVTGYANHVYLEPSFWDLKMIFGQLDQSVEPLAVEQHTAITIPWAQAKVLNYFLSAQIAAHEGMNGKIVLTKKILPQDVPAPTAEVVKEDPRAQTIYDAVKKLRDAFLAENPGI